MLSLRMSERTLAYFRDVVETGTVVVVGAGGVGKTAVIEALLRVDERSPSKSPNGSRRVSVYRHCNYPQELFTTHKANGALIDNVALPECPPNMRFFEIPDCNIEDMHGPCNNWLDMGVDGKIDCVVLVTTNVANAKHMRNIEETCCRSSMRVPYAINVVNVVVGCEASAALGGTSMCDTYLERTFNDFTRPTVRIVSLAHFLYDGFNIMFQPPSDFEPASPSYNPTSPPSYSPTSPSYSPTSPPAASHSPTSPPESPMWHSPEDLPLNPFEDDHTNVILDPSNPEYHHGIACEHRRKLALRDMREAVWRLNALEAVYGSVLENHKKLLGDRLACYRRIKAYCRRLRRYSGVKAIIDVIGAKDRATKTKARATKTKARAMKAVRRNKAAKKF